ncbi:hypothetical protein QLX08_003080 [Tetragonisca angustula]|uniref:Uncharacterized protein n=1 Tax=Tetragonisca angustula TaxID=166442 RepID=A0AAW1A865_9HYME
MKDLSYFLGSITTRFKYHYSLLPEKVSEDQAFDDSAIFEKIIYQTDCSNGPLNEQRNPEISFPTERETIWSLAKPILVRCPAIGRRDPRKQGATSPSGLPGRCSNTIRPNRRSSGRVTKPWNTRRTDAGQRPDAKRFSAGSREALQKHCRLGAVVAGGAVR